MRFSPIAFAWPKSLQQGQPGGDSCTLLRPPLGCNPLCTPKPLFPEHKLSGALLEAELREGSLSHPAVMGCSLSLALQMFVPVLPP